MIYSERIAQALEHIRQSGTVLSWKYNEYADAITVELKLPEETRECPEGNCGLPTCQYCYPASPSEAMEVLAAALPRGFKFAELTSEPVCRHPVLIDSREQPGVDIYVCARCDAVVKINEREVSRSPLSAATNNGRAAP